MSDPTRGVPRGIDEVDMGQGTEARDAKKEAVLSFEEFSGMVEVYSGRPGKMKRYYNFPLIFSGGFIAEDLRKSEHYKRLAEEKGELVQSLLEAGESLLSATPSQEMLEKLYEAYREMRSYGASEEDLLMDISEFKTKK